MNKSLTERETAFLNELFERTSWTFEPEFEHDNLRSDNGFNEFANAKELSGVMNYTEKEIEGFLSSLNKKGAIYIESGEEYGTESNVIWLTEEGYKLIK